MVQSIILLTYKGKVLLMHKDYILATLEQNPWHFISGIRRKNESSEQAIQREVEEETSIQLKSIEFLGSLDELEEKNYCYRMHLTDDNVNNIVHKSGKILGFFSIKELKTLSLSIPTKLLIAKHSSLLGKLDEEEKN